MIGGAFLIGLAYASLNILGNPLLAILMYSILVAVGEVINFPLIPTVAMRRANEDNQGKYMGLVSMMFATAFLLAPITGLPIIELIGYEQYFYMAASLSILSAACLTLLKRYLEKRQAPT